MPCHFLILCMLGKNFCRQHFGKNNIFSWKIDFDISCKLSPVCIKCQCLFSGKNKIKEKILLIYHLPNLRREWSRLKGTIVFMYDFSLRNGQMTKERQSWKISLLNVRRNRKDLCEITWKTTFRSSRETSQDIYQGLFLSTYSHFLTPGVLVGVLRWVYFPEDFLRMSIWW